MYSRFSPVSVSQHHDHCILSKTCAKFDFPLAGLIFLYRIRHRDVLSLIATVTYHKIIMSRSDWRFQQPVAFATDWNAWLLHGLQWAVICRIGTSCTLFGVRLYRRSFGRLTAAPSLPTESRVAQTCTPIFVRRPIRSKTEWSIVCVLWIFPPLSSGCFTTSASEILSREITSYTACARIVQPPVL